MRTSVWVALALLALVIAFGLWDTMTMREQSERYISAAEELLVLTQDGQWQRADEAAAAYRERWKATNAWMQVLVVHEELDAVSMALRRIHAGIEAQDPSLCREGCAELREYAEHLYHRDAFTLGNVL